MDPSASARGPWASTAPCGPAPAGSRAPGLSPRPRRSCRRSSAPSRETGFDVSVGAESRAALLEADQAEERSVGGDHGHPADCVIDQQAVHHSRASVDHGIAGARVPVGGRSVRVKVPTSLLPSVNNTMCTWSLLKAARACVIDAWAGSVFGRRSMTSRTVVLVSAVLSQG